MVKKSRTPTQDELMPGFTLMGKMLIMIGAILLLLGLIMTFGSKIPWIGRLPGDIIIKKGISAFTFLLLPAL